MTKNERIAELGKCNKIAQACVIDNNSIPHFLICEELKKMYILLDFKGCCEDFDNHKKTECLDYIIQSLKKRNDEINQKYRNNKKEIDYFNNFVLRQLKETSFNCIKYLKLAYNLYCPLED